MPTFNESFRDGRFLSCVERWHTLRQGGISISKSQHPDTYHKKPLFCALMFCAFQGLRWPLRDYLAGKQTGSLRTAMKSARDWLQDNHLFLYAKGDIDPDLDPEDLIDYEAAEKILWDAGVRRLRDERRQQLSNPRRPDPRRPI
ncbi:MAG: hypothetical protein V1753_06890 [Pseudomonadota bacterium]